MKQSNLTFAAGFLGVEAKIAEKQGKKQKVFDWDKAAKIIKEKYEIFPNLTAEAGLQGDWEYTGGIIFEDGKHTNDNYTYLSSNWAIPTLLLYDGDVSLEEVECFVDDDDNRFSSNSKWDEQSIKILNE